MSCETSDEKLLAVIKSFDGLNVTMPFKVRVAKLLRAEIGFVNTIGKNIIPQSTDGYGIVKALRAHGIEFKDKKLWIVGAEEQPKLALTNCLSTDVKWRF